MDDGRTALLLTLVALFAKGGVNQQLESVKTIEKDCCEEKRRKIQHNKQQVSLNNEPTLSIHSLQRFPVLYFLTSCFSHQV